MRIDYLMVYVMWFYLIGHFTIRWIKSGITLVRTPVPAADLNCIANRKAATDD